MHGRDDDEAEERRRQELERQSLSFGDLVHGEKRRTATGEVDGRHDFRELRLKQVPLRVRLDVNSALRAAMKEAGYTSFPKFFERMFADYLERHPLGPETMKKLPSIKQLQEQFLRKRDEDDGK